ncbi:hypothetical protein BYZ73_01290 [Rhodovulum viride]|uniref:Membrane protein YccC n=1 Tax=Rhodovulum viride TaxID=1231134 RepID=A0ABX9DPR1_9RHOB|nr:FUSC family protein [Rhodovulum viride]RAP43371.1 hypothetical protein BYZ73_01290 [Rhodovulum viride]
MERSRAVLATLGFDPKHLSFAGRTALAACAALAVAWAAGLEHPQWAAMTVWAASQPTRGQLLEKSFFRIAGTVSGTAAGILLVLAGGLHPLLLVLGLALWVAACTGIGNVQRGFVSYGTVLAGYTAAMVALLESSLPDRVVLLGADRLATVLTGVVVAMVFGYAFAPPTASPEIRRRAARLIADILDELAARMDGHAERPDRGGALLAEMASIEDGLDPQAAGSIRSRRVVRSTRAVLGAGLSALLWVRRNPAHALCPGAAQPFRQAADDLRLDHIDRARSTLSASAGLVAAHPRLLGVVRDLALALDHWQNPDARTPDRSLPAVISRDWIGAREAALRAGGAILLFGAVWQATGWHAGPYLLLGLSIMISLFSTFENPRAMMRNVFLGSLFGALGALACRWLVWPLAGAEYQLILLAFPFILFGPFLVGHRRTAAISFDYNMTLMLMLQPVWPLAGKFLDSVEIGLAILAAPITAFVAYRFVYPAGLRRRLRTQFRMMIADLAALASDDQALTHRAVWRARLYHRALRLVRLSEKASRAKDRGQRASLAILDLGHATMRAKDLLERGAVTPGAARALTGFIGRVAHLPDRPERCLSALRRIEERLPEDELRPFRKAACELEGLLDDFRQSLV